jgi:SAM-dependent methyltransferase
VSNPELDRIRSEYQTRDAGASSPYRWENPGYVSYMQGLERALLRALSDTGVELGGASVLDVGCGSGYFLNRLREYGAERCEGFDLMENRIADARERYPALEWHVGSATDLPFDDGTFDLVTQFTCLSSIVDDATRLSAAHEMRRVAAGGWVLSVDTRRASAPEAATPTAALDARELRRLFGEPALLRRPLLNFAVAQKTGRHELAALALTLPPFARSHYIGLWRAQTER